MNVQAPIGHNNPPDPIETVIAEYDNIITEAQNWADGQPVTDEASMKVVDVLIKGFKEYRSALAEAAKERTEPLYKAWKAEVAAVKIYTDDADLIQKSLVALVDPFKKEKLRKAEEAKRAEWDIAKKTRQEAEERAAQARDSDLEAQREAIALKQAAIDAENAAKAISKTAPKGMRKVLKFEILSHDTGLAWINENDRDALEEFVETYVRKHHKAKDIDGVRTWSEMEAF